MTTVPARGRLRAGAYARLAKLDVFDYYLAVPVVWAFLPPEWRTDGRTLLVLALCLIGAVAVLAAGVALDDVTGYRDGSDAANYGADPANRRLARKPLLTGELTVSDARRFAAVAAGAGAACWLAAWLLSPGRPGWVLAVATACLVVAVGYSAGPRFSYRGGQELVLLGFGLGVVVLGYGAATGRSGGTIVTVGLLFGLGPLLFGLYANVNDARGDAAAGRRTLATTLGPAGHRKVILAVSAAETVLVLAGGMPGWFILLYAPVLVLRLRQIAVGRSPGGTLAARRLGIHTHRLAAALLAAAGLILGVIA